MSAPNPARDRKEDERKVKLIQELAIEEIREDPVVVMFIEKYQFVRLPLTERDTWALKIELLRLLSRNRKPRNFII